MTRQKAMTRNGALNIAAEIRMAGYAAGLVNEFGGWQGWVIEIIHWSHDGQLQRTIVRDIAAGRSWLEYKKAEVS